MQTRNREFCRSNAKILRSEKIVWKEFYCNLRKSGRVIRNLRRWA